MRIIEKMQKHSKVEEAAIKLVRDLEMQIKALHTSYLVSGIHSQFKFNLNCLFNLNGLMCSRPHQIEIIYYCDKCTLDLQCTVECATLCLNKVHFLALKQQLRLHSELRRLLYATNDPSKIFPFVVINAFK